MDEWNIPRTRSRGGRYEMSQEEKDYLKSFAVNGIISFEDHLRATNEILNGKAPVKVRGKLIESW